MKLFNKTRNQQIVAKVIPAKSFSERTRGLMFRSSWDNDTSLWIHRCNSIHTAFVRFPIDVVFVDKNLKVKKIVEKIKPWRLVLPVWSSSSVFEFISSDSISDSVLEKVNIGDELYVGA